MEKKKLHDINSFLVFKIGNEEFAANASKVQRILEMQILTSLPKVYKYMKGVINLMGKVLPVIDARLKMGMEEKEPDAQTCIIVLEIVKGTKVVETGIIVDSVQSVIEIDEHEIKDPPTLGFEVNSDFISGMVEQESKFIMLLDVDNVFSVDEVVSLQEISETELTEEIEEEEK
ncbi:MAG: chemotaxis protein CheW [Salinivirgaceae bacterium]|nr:chemotaxis protein CheW [Salinivirgaceae bacterium]